VCPGCACRYIHIRAISGAYRTNCNIKANIKAYFYNSIEISSLLIISGNIIAYFVQIADNVQQHDTQFTYYRRNGISMFKKLLAAGAATVTAAMMTLPATAWFGGFGFGRGLGFGLGFGGLGLGFGGLG
jgi:hypothetical protein